MNLYLRYFDVETLVYSVEEAFDFLYSIPEICMNPNIEKDIRDYVNSDIVYPKRYKVRPRVYFIIIKTTAANMTDFKLKKALNPQSAATKESQKEQAVSAIVALNTEKAGWYEGELTFKRVVTLPQTGKCEYQDTHVVYQCKAMSGMDCYERILEHLRERVDRRSQFPSAKGRNFSFKYLGKWK